MKPMLGLMLVAALQQQSCIEKAAGPPEQIETDISREFAPYFPQVRVRARPDQKYIEIFTCTQGLGRSAFEQLDPQIVQRIESHPKVVLLRGAIVNLAEAFGRRIPYDYIQVDFEDHALLWQRRGGLMQRVDHRSFGVNWMLYLKDYDETCFPKLSLAPIQIPLSQSSPDDLTSLRLTSEQCVSLSNAIAEMKEKSSDRPTVSDLIQMSAAYCK